MGQAQKATLPTLGAMVRALGRRSRYGVCVADRREGHLSRQRWHELRNSPEPKTVC
jgi:hypothetical protein